jgi:hypothetical protein
MGRGINKSMNGQNRETGKMRFVSLIRFIPDYIGWGNKYTETGGN